MNKIISIFIVLAAMLWFAADTHSEDAKKLYTCGMHPQVIQDHPGNCPICGMKLTPIRKQAGDSPAGERKLKFYKSTMTPGETSPTPAKDSMGMDMVPVYEDAGGTDNPSAIAVDAATRQNMNLRTAEVRRGPLRKTIRTLGAIDYNETALADVTTKFKGWIEKLNVDATGQLVHRGEPMFEIYSPELYSAEVEFLLALDAGSTNDPGALALRETAASKLKFFDVPDAQIAELEKSRTPRKALPVAAPMSGFVIEKNVVAGQMVDAGMKLYRLADLGIVWVLAQVYEQDLAFVQLGQEAVVKVASLPDREFRGRVTFIYPTVDEKTRTARVRLEFENPGYYLKPGMFVSAQIHAELEASAVLVPESAVLRSGARNTVFVALDGGKFEARDVALGVEAENALIQVTSGLSAGERVVTSGQFLLDSESQLQEAIEKMRGPTSTAKPETTSVNSTNEAVVAASAKTETEAVVYVCPMPEHVSIVYDHAGNCPICGMALVPVTPSALKKIQPGGKVLYYTCPMPEHANVHEEKPGKCPLCAMTLIPVMAQPETKTKQLYTCPMHSEVIADKPGICPKCGMDLVPVKK
ncbi:MAG TPA: efflux RND transporter periplasmic adaptor subunit [Candidatus Limnocylindrales bacterium]|nr:efflux RND transporter periplasmic adaptor subunit [Candidatus Limnocylindrales bacterium]